MRRSTLLGRALGGELQVSDAVAGFQKPDNEAVVLDGALHVAACGANSLRIDSKRGESVSRRTYDNVLLPNETSTNITSTRTCPSTAPHSDSVFLTMKAHA